MKNCNCDTDINRDGSGQLQRYLIALDPAYAPIDDRSTEDLLVFAKKYAAQIRFYDIPESKITDSTPVKKISWREFFRRDMAVIAASVGLTSAESFKKEYDEVNQRLRYNTTPEVYAALYAPILGMLKKIDRWYSVAIPENPLYADLKLAIESDLKMQVQKIMAYEEGFKYVDPSVDLKIDLDSIENKEAWGINETVPPDASIYTGTTQQEKILSASLFTEDIFHAFYNFLNRLITDSEKYMQFAMEQYPAHQPHLALFITFLQLFNKAQQQLNGLTGRMLDFYYKDVLHLETKPSIADKVHIVFELAKDVIEYGLVTGTALKAGPDKSGKEQLYKTTGDLVINQAKVKELKTIFIDKEDSGTVNNIKTIYARPVANSADGYGLPFETATPKWPTFGKGIPVIDDPANICQFVEKANELLNSKNETQIGFAIASPQLVLRGGNRIIKLQMAALTGLKGKKLEIWLSAEDGWLTIDKEITEKNEIIKTLLDDGGDLSTGMPAESGYFIDLATTVLYICLPVVEKAVVPFNLELHPGRNYATPYPVMQVMMGPDIDFNPAVFNKVTIRDLALSVRVGSINIPQNFSEFTLTGKVIDADSLQPLPDVMVAEYAPQFPNKVNTDGNGDFSISTSVKKILVFQTPGYKLRLIAVTSQDPMTVELTKGDRTDTLDTAALIIPSFFDGLKQLTLQNDDGIIAPDKPFDPFTAYPKFGSSLYIGSDEVFNKPVDELAIHIRHQSDTADALFDLNYLIIASRNSEILKKIEFFKLSVLERKEWTALCTSRGGNFMEGLLSEDILFKKDNDGKVSHLPPLTRTPLLYPTELKSQTIKGFVQVQNNIAPDIFDDSGTEGANQKDIFQKMAELAILLKVKEISVSYFSKLVSLEPETDQFFHVYPFGITEIYTQSIDPSPRVRKELAALLKNKNTAYKSLKKMPAQFERLDAAKDYLLVNAHQLLLPQFTYLSPYEQYRDTTKRVTKANRRIKIAGDLNSEAAAKKDGDDIAEQLILSASGWTEKINGGANQYSANLQEEGMLFIGLEKAKPLQMVSVLFQFAEGSAEDEDNDPPEIHWSYLTNNEWRPFKEESIVSDGTIGFQTTGIVKIEIPQDATSNNTIMTGGLYWLCASVTANSNRIPMLVDIVTQAVLANFEDNINDPSHFDDSLPAGSISKLSIAVAQVSKVQQPFASFDGKHAEIGKEFYTRVSERLRHKARAITPWDYEHLVLDRFPSVYKIKCITHTDPNCLCTQVTGEITVTGVKKTELEYDFINGSWQMTEAINARLQTVMKEMVSNPTGRADIRAYGVKPEEKKIAEGFCDQVIKTKFEKAGIAADRLKFATPEGKFRTADLFFNFTNTSTEKACCGPQIAPGHVLLVPISNLKNRNAVNPLQPKTARRVLLEIEAYIKERTSPFVHVHAKNPVYEQVLVFFRVKFMDGFDKGFHMKKLNDEIVHYLTPWAFDDVTEVKFGQKIYASSIINFIEERVYVDFITDFLMLVCRDECCDDVVREANDSNNEDALNKISGCCGMEILLQDEADFIGDIVAKPSTARSLLVSAPRHIIIPYQEPAILSPCQTLKLKREGGNALIDKEKIKELIAARETPVAEIKPVTAVMDNPVKAMPAPAQEAIVMNTVKSTGKQKQVKKPAEKKQTVKAAKKNTKTPKEK